MLDDLDKTGCKNEDTKKKKKFNKKTENPRKDKWKFEAPQEGETRKKVSDRKKNHHCDKPHGREVKPIWAMRKPSEHKNFAKPQPKTTDSDLETTDELRSLLTDFKKYFFKARNLACTN